MYKTAIMNIETTKLELMQLLLKTQKESVLEKVKAVFEAESDTFFSNPETDIKSRAKASLNNIEKGETTSIEDFKDKVATWKSQQTI